VPDNRPDLRAPVNGRSHLTRPQHFDGVAADGLVTVTVSESGELLGVHIYPGEYRRDEPPGLANMGDMVVEALQAAKARATGFADSHPSTPDRD
jgi:DNA-binding protein YbaB